VIEFEQLHPALRYHIINSLGWGDLRPTQRDAIMPIHGGEDVLLLAPTAGGKTEAAMLPLLSRAARESWSDLSVLYVCPLKALLNNLEPRLARYTSFVGRRAALWHGDVGEAARRRILNDPPDVLLTTPESLEAILVSARVDHHALLSSVRAVVVDELHAFAGDDRGWHLLAVLARIEHLAGRRIQRIGLSATVGNPEELLRWLTQGRGGRVVGAGSGPPDGDVTIDYVGSVANAVTLLSRLHRGERRLVFADSRARVEELATGLRSAGVRTFASHGSLSADERRQAEAAFGTEPDCAIVATSTLELGIDVGDLDRVVQVGAPPSVASFVQRMGRTGRRVNTTRNCLFLAIDDYDLLLSLGICGLWHEGRVEHIVPAPRPLHLFAQQVMALILQEAGIARCDLDAWLGPTFDVLAPGDRETVLAYMLSTGMLNSDNGVLGLGPRAESMFGRRHFGDLVVSFSSPMLLSVMHGRSELGTVHPLALASPPEGEPLIILLTGRSWKVVNIDWRRRRLSVVPAEGGGRARWFGRGRPATFSVCQSVEAVIAGGMPGCNLSRRAEAKLKEIRERLPFVDGASVPVVSDGKGTVRVWTFAGGLANAALSEAISGTVGRADDFCITMRPAESARVADMLAGLNSAGVNPTVPDRLSQELKFNECLPSELAADVVKTRLSDMQAIANTIKRDRRVVLDID
jgi:ATP-dependent helicase Lhr and Lhr-like helicase